jgi:hypothetical protein
VAKPDPQNRQIFVAYPWKLYSNRANYKKAYTKLEKALSVKFVFAEERLADKHMLDKIEEMIGSSAFGIYDVSQWNPNVSLEYGLARGLKARAFIAFNPDKTDLSDVPTDVRGYDRLQYTDLEELSGNVASLIAQELGPTAPVPDPLEADRKRLVEVIRSRPGQTAADLTAEFPAGIDYVQLLIRRSTVELETRGQTRAMKYYIKGAAPPKK